MWIIGFDSSHCMIFAVDHTSIKGYTIEIGLQEIDATTHSNFNIQLF
jgi:hypothetical protein